MLLEKKSALCCKYLIRVNLESHVACERFTIKVLIPGKGGRGMTLW